jgi:hypothetical protein
MLTLTNLRIQLDFMTPGEDPVHSWDDGFQTTLADLRNWADQQPQQDDGLDIDALTALLKRDRPTGTDAESGGRRDAMDRLLGWLTIHHAAASTSPTAAAPVAPTLADLTAQLDDLTLHDDTGDAHDEGYMTALDELRRWAGGQNALIVSALLLHIENERPLEGLDDPFDDGYATALADITAWLDRAHGVSLHVELNHAADVIRAASIAVRDDRTVHAFRYSDDLQRTASSIDQCAQRLARRAASRPAS